MNTCFECQEELSGKDRLATFFEGGGYVEYCKPCYVKTFGEDFSNFDPSDPMVCGDCYDEGRTTPAEVVDVESLRTHWEKEHKRH